MNITTKQARREAKQLFRLCCHNGLIDENRARSLLNHILQANPRGSLPVLEQFKRLVKLTYAERTAKVETAMPLPPEESGAIQAKLESAYGPGLNVSFIREPALIGGMRVTVGSDVYDGSVQGRLAALDQRFSN